MSVNYQFLLNLIENRANQNPSIRVLDYGCGRGEIVKRARLKSIDMYGADVFHNGPLIPAMLATENLLGNVIREISDGKLQFPDEFFDLVVSNQVFEHVPDLCMVLKEIRRVLKPCGMMVALFPSREIFREGHTGIPFLHKFPNNYFRYFYALCLRKIGLGKGLNDPSVSPKEWVERKLTYIDTKTFYRSAKEINKLLNKDFSWNHREEDIILFRADHLNDLLCVIIRIFIRIPGLKQIGVFMFTRLAGYLIIASPK